MGRGSGQSPAFLTVIFCTVSSSGICRHISRQIFKYGLQLCIMCAMISLEFADTVLIGAIQLEKNDQVQRRLGCQRRKDPSRSSR